MKSLLKGILTFILSLFIFTIINAQSNYTTLSGHLLDNETKEPLAFASIYIKGTSTGTTSNSAGSFVFHIPKNTNKPIVISIIGYVSVEKFPEQFVSNNPIYLKASTIELNEVLVTSSKKPLTAKEIVKRAYNSISKNYPTEPYILEGFIRDLQNEDNKYVEYLECAAKFYNQSYNGGTQVELMEVRTSYIADKHPWNDIWERKNSIADLIEDEPIRFDNKLIKSMRGWHYEIEKIVPYDNKTVYKIIGTNKPFKKSVLYIDVESFAFVRTEFTRAIVNGKNYRRRLTNGQQEIYYNVIFEYQEYNSKMYLKYQKEEDIWQIFEDSQSDSLLFTKNPKKELFINKVILQNVAEYPFSHNLRYDLSIENQATKYNPEFWKHFNIPTQTVKESKILEYLKKANIEAEKKE